MDTPALPPPAAVDRPVLVGHRGAPAEAPENTPAAFAAAADAGATWVELDVRLTADGTVVVHHDPLLADGRALVELSGDQAADAGVHAFEEVLAGLPAGLGVDVEVKNFPTEPDHDPDMAVVRAAHAVIDACAGERPVVVSSFNPLVLLASAEVAPARDRALLTIGTPLPAGIDAAVELGCTGLFPHDSTEDLTAGGLRDARRAGLVVMVWTVDDPGRAAALATAGVDAICTNDPRRLAAGLGGVALRRSG